MKISKSKLFAWFFLSNKEAPLESTVNTGHSANNFHSRANELKNMSVSLYGADELATVKNIYQLLNGELVDLLYILQKNVPAMSTLRSDSESHLNYCEQLKTLLSTDNFLNTPIEAICLIINEVNDLLISPVLLAKKIEGDKQLSNLSFRHSGLTRITPTLFELIRAHPELKIIDLSGNAIRELPTGCFANMSSLNALYLKDNKIARLPKNSFIGCDELKQLDLDGNKLKFIHKSNRACLEKTGNLGLDINCSSKPGSSILFNFAKKYAPKISAACSALFFILFAQYVGITSSIAYIAAAALSVSMYALSNVCFEKFSAWRNKQGLLLEKIKKEVEVKAFVSDKGLLNDTQLLFSPSTYLNYESFYYGLRKKNYGSYHEIADTQDELLVKKANRNTLIHK